MFKLKLFRFVFVCLASMLGFVWSISPVFAQSAAQSLATEIDQFFAAGAQGYLVWQYSGNKGNGQIFASDPYAFFQGTPDGEAICKVLKEKADQYPDKFVGVNMWDAGAGAHPGNKVNIHLKWLHDSCGVKVVRIFAKAGEKNGVEKVLNAANGTGVQILVAVGDYSNGGGGIPSGVSSQWFPDTLAAINNRNSGNEFYKLAADVASLKGHPSFWGAEVANEIHCRGDVKILEDYRNLGEAFARLFGGKVGFGQKASENTTMCDSPGVDFEGQSHFQYTNSPSNITISSAHYYNPAEKALALQAAQQAVSQGKLFYIGEAPPKMNANDVNPTQNINYQTIPYDFDQYYIHPIKGLEPKNKDVIRDDLIKQGYEARCAAPGFKIILDQQGVDAMHDYLECGPRGCNSPGGDGGVLGGIGIEGAPDTLNPNPLSDRVVSLLKVDYRDALVPVLRDMNRLPQLKRSLEDYFGYKYPTANNYGVGEVRSSAINSLLTSNQRCVQSALSLLQREVMCEKLENPDACALYAPTVPETALNVKGLLDAYKSYSGGSSNHQEICTKIVAGPTNELRRGMLNLPLHIENSYRLAFLVTTIRTKVPFPGSMMSLFQHPKRGPLGVGPDPKHVVLITAFKVPDITTNKGTIEGEGDSGNTGFNDPAILTRDVLIPAAVKQKLDADGQAERKRLLDMGRYVGNIEQDDSSMAIECKLSGVGGQQCLDPMTGAVVDLINAQSLIENENEKALEDGTLNKDQLTSTQLEQLFKLDCDETPGETTDYIFDPAQLAPLGDAGRVFKTDWGVAILENLFTDETHMISPNAPIDPTYADTNNNKTGGWHWGLKSVFYVTDGNEGSFGRFDPEEDGRQVHHYIVYPEGYDIKTIEAVMSGTFFTSNQIEDLKEKAMDYERLELKDDKVTFEGGSASKTYEDKTDCKKVTKTDSTGMPYTDYECEEKTFGFSLATDQEPRHAGVLGGRLGYWVHTIQLQLQRAGSLTHQYLKNCDTTENFLLDACGGVAQSQVAVGSNVSADFTDISSFQIKYWSGVDVIFQPPSQELWNAIVAAANKHGCDPWMVLAAAHSESQSYTNHTTPNAVGALGVFQFTPGAWTTWWRKNASGVNQCSLHQPPTFTQDGFDYSSPTNIQAAADAACRLLLWTGAQKYYDNQSEFIRAFSQRGDNQYGQIWNAYPPQGDYVWRLWHKLLETAGKSPMAQPNGYPYARCS